MTPLAQANAAAVARQDVHPRNDVSHTAASLKDELPHTRSFRPKRYCNGNPYHSDPLYDLIVPPIAWSRSWMAERARPILTYCQSN